MARVVFVVFIAAASAMVLGPVVLAIVESARGWSSADTDEALGIDMFCKGRIEGEWCGVDMDGTMLMIIGDDGRGAGAVREEGHVVPFVVEMVGFGEKGRVDLAFRRIGDQGAPSTKVAAYPSFDWIMLSAKPWRTGPLRLERVQRAASRGDNLSELVAAAEAARGVWEGSAAR